MALVTCDFFSEALELGTSMTVVLPQPTEAQIGVASTRDLRGRAAAALPPARHVRRPHRVAALHLDRALRHRAGRGRGDAGRGPQLLRRRGARAPLLDLPLRGAADGRRPVLPGLRAARGHLRRRPVDGRLRRPEVGAAPARALRRGGEPLGRARRGGPGRPRRAAGAAGPDLRRDARPRTTTCSRCWPRPTPRRSPRCTSPAAPRTSSSPATPASSTRRTNAASTSRSTSARASTSGASGTPRSRACCAGSPSSPPEP